MTPSAVPAAGLAVLLAALTACSGSASTADPTPTTTRPAPATSSVGPLPGPTATDADSGIRLQLPAGWVAVPLGAAAHATLTKAVPNPSEVGELEQQMRLGLSRGMRVFAVRPHGTAEPDSLNVAVTGAPSSTLETLRPQIELSVTRFAEGPPRFDTVDLQAGRALRVHYRLTGGGSTTQFYVLANAQAYVLTLTVATAAADDVAVSQAVAESLRLSPAA